jgi:hypothetical protein
MLQVEAIGIEEEEEEKEETTIGSIENWDVGERMFGIL